MRRNHIGEIVGADVDAPAVATEEPRNRVIEGFELAKGRPCEDDLLASLDAGLG